MCMFSLFNIEFVLKIAFVSTYIFRIIVKKVPINNIWKFMGVHFNAARVCNCIYFIGITIEITQIIHKLIIMPLRK